MQHFCCAKAQAGCLKYFGFHLDFDLTFEKNFGLWLDLD